MLADLIVVCCWMNRLTETIKNTAYLLEQGTTNAPIGMRRSKSGRIHVCVSGEKLELEMHLMRRKLAIKQRMVNGCALGLPKHEYPRLFLGSVLSLLLTDRTQSVGMQL